MMGRVVRLHPGIGEMAQRFESYATPCDKPQPPWRQQATSLQGRDALSAQACLRFRVGGACCAGVSSFVLHTR